MGGKKYRFVLVDEPETLVPVRYRPSRSNVYYVTRRIADPLLSLLQAFESVSRRGAGPFSWTWHPGENPIAFVLDALDEGVILRDHDGRRIYQNSAASNLMEDVSPPLRTDLGPYKTMPGPEGDYEIRTMKFSNPEGDGYYFIEVIRQIDSL